MLKFIPKMRSSFLFFVIALFTLELLTSCMRRRPMTIDTSTLPGLKAIAVVKKPTKKQRKRATSKMRVMGLKEVALSLGAQAGLAWQARMIDDQLAKQARRLDAVYDFNSLILSNHILPPVLLEGRNTFNLADAQTIRISDRTYKLAKQARFVTAAPNWREYIWMDYKRPDPPNVTLLPKTRQERALWCYYVEKGWRNGLEQGSIILEESLARLNEDFRGMILYRKLLAMNMVSAPYVSHTDLGITGDTSEMHIDDKVLRITALPALNTNSKEWRAAVVKDERTLEKLKVMEQKARENRLNITQHDWEPVISPVN